MLFMAGVSSELATEDDKVLDWTSDNNGQGRVEDSNSRDNSEAEAITTVLSRGSQQHSSRKDFQTVASSPKLLDRPTRRRAAA